MRKKKFIFITVLFLITTLLRIDVKADGIREHCIDNDMVHNYLANVEYDNSNYSYSMVEAFIDTKAIKLTPSPLKIDIPKTDSSIMYKIQYSDNEGYIDYKEKIIANNKKTYDLYNLMPNKLYYIRIISVDKNYKEKIISRQKVKTTGLVYALRIEGVGNVRDIGGKSTKLGSEVALGRIYRGGNLDSISYNGLSEMVCNQDITVEIDFRNNNELGLDTEDTRDDYVPRFYEYYNFQIGDFTHIEKGYSEKYANVFRQILMCLREGKNVYIHCAGGADRTGAMSAIIEGVLGVSESDICKDYELTSFVEIPRIRYYNSKYQSTDRRYAQAISKIKKYPGETLCDKWAEFLKIGGVTDAEIDEFRRIMIIDY